MSPLKDSKELNLASDKLFETLRPTKVLLNQDSNYQLYMMIPENLYQDFTSRNSREKISQFLNTALEAIFGEAWKKTKDLTRVMSHPDSTYLKYSEIPFPIDLTQKSITLLTQTTDTVLDFDHPWHFNNRRVIPIGDALVAMGPFEGGQAERGLKDVPELLKYANSSLGADDFQTLKLYLKESAEAFIQFKMETYLGFAPELYELAPDNEGMF